MKNKQSIPLLILFLALTLPSAWSARGDAELGIPPELKGFQGMMTGELIGKKGETNLEFKISSIKRVWKGNRAEQPEKSVGKSLTVTLSEIGDRHRETIMENFRKLEPGDLIEIEVFDLGESILCVKEWLKKVEDR